MLNQQTLALLSSLVLGLVAVTQGVEVKGEEKTFFGVYSDDQCTVPLMASVPTSTRTVVGNGECYTFSYNTPDGRVQTNSEDMFNCCKGKPFSVHILCCLSLMFTNIMV